MGAPSAAQVDERMEVVRGGLVPYADRTLSEADIKDILRLVFRATYKKPKPTPEQAGAAYATLEHLVGQSCDRRKLIANVTRLVANWHFIREGMRVPEWDGSTTEADVVFLGVDKALKKLPGGQLGRDATVKLKTGLGAGIISCVALFKRSTELFLEHESGASTLDCPFEEIAGMAARTTVRLNQDGTCSLGRLYTTDQQRKHNRHLAQLRTDPGKCQKGLPCNMCQLDIVQCPLAVWTPNKEGQHG